MDELTRLTTALAERYVIDREIGRGGMAVVYLARDVKHDRRVALKLLNPELGAVLGVERFLSEIRVTANLQHPNLLPLFDSGEADGLLFYVMPYVEGESLRARLEHEKQLPIDEAVRIASGVAAALDYAHRNGVIHRDLKPENILLQDGQPVIADFGIALAVSRAGGNRITQTGLSLGTPQYMSPEQATGDRVIDGRTDIYSLGAVTYEMLVGDPPHLGGTSQAIISKLLTEKPRSIRAARESVPLHVEAAIEHALAKLPADRFATAHEFSEALQGRGAVAASAANAAPPWIASRAKRIAAAAVSLSLAAAAGALLWKWFGPIPPQPARPMVRFDIHLPRDAEPVSPPSTTGAHIAFSPDGARIAYVGKSKSKSGFQLYSRSLDQVDPVPIAGSDSGWFPFFSPDGQSLGFVQGQRIVRVPLAGGPVTPLCDVTGLVYGASWGRSDTIVFAAAGGLFEVPAAGGRANLFAKPGTDESFRWPDAMPDDRVVLFSVFQRGAVHLATATRATGEVHRLEQQGGSPQYVDGGYVVFSTPGASGHGSISGARFDPRRLDVLGTPLLIAERIDVGPQGGRDVSVSRSGAIAYVASLAGHSRLVLVDRKGTARDAGLDTGAYSDPAVSPDGRRVALSRTPNEYSTLSDVWVLDLIQHSRTRLTHDTTAGIPIWTRNGQRIAYTRFHAQGFGGSIYSIPIDGSGAPEPLVVAPGSSWPKAFLTDGSLLYINWSTTTTKTGIWQTGVGAGAPPRKILVNEFANYQPSMSPDGKWFAYVSDESGRPEVYVRPFPGPGGRSIVSLDGGSAPVWSPTGREIFYRNGPQMMAVAVQTQPAFEVGIRTLLFTGDYTYDPLVPEYDVTRDGQTFVMLQPVSVGEQSVVVLLNWFDKLRGKQ